MEAEIESRPAVNGRPKAEHNGQGTALDEQTKIHGQRESVGGMRREKAVLTTAHTVNNLDGVLNERVVAGSPSANERLDDKFNRHAHHHNGKHGASDREEYLRHGVVVFDDNIDEYHVERYPREARSEGRCQGIDEERVAPVEPGKHHSV